MILNREQIDSKRASSGIPYFVKAWDGEILIKKWSGIDRAKILTKVAEVYGTEDIDEISTNPALKAHSITAVTELTAEVVAMSLIDETGNMVYNSTEEDRFYIQGFEADLLQELFEACAKANGLSEKSLKEEIKN
jgi:hypothetical protein